MEELNDIKLLANTILKRIETLEAKINAQQEKPETSEAEAKPVSSEAIPAGIQIKDAAPKIDFAQAKAKASHKAKSILKPVQKRDWEAFFGKWLMPLVAVAFLFPVFGLGLKFTFALVQPIGRVLISLIVASAFMGVGELFRRKDYHYFGYVLMGGGLGGYYFSVFAGHHYYELIPLMPATLLLLGVTGLACGLSIVYNTKWLAVMGAFGGFLTPLFFDLKFSLSTLFGYILCLNIGLLTVSFSKNWRVLNSLGLFFTWLVFGRWYMHYRADSFWLSLMYINISFFIYSIAPYAGQLRQKEFKSHSFHFLLIFVNAITAFLFNYNLIEYHYSKVEVSLVTIFNAVFFIAIAHDMLRRGLHKRPAFNYFVAMALFFITITVPIVFKGYMVTISWMLLSSLLFWLGKKLSDQKMVYFSFIVGFCGLWHFAFFDLQFLRFRIRYWWYFRESVSSFIPRLATYISIVGALAFNCHAYRKLSKEVNKKVLGFYSLLCLLFLFFFTNIEVSHFAYQLKSSYSVLAVSMVWCAFTLGLMIVGIIKRQMALRYLSIGLFLLTSFKAVFQDWLKYRNDTGLLIIDLAVITTCLLVTSFLFIRFKDRSNDHEVKRATSN